MSSLAIKAAKLHFGAHHRPGLSLTAGSRVKYARGVAEKRLIVLNGGNGIAAASFDTKRHFCKREVIGDRRSDSFRTRGIIPDNWGLARQELRYGVQ